MATTPHDGPTTVTFTGFSGSVTGITVTKVDQSGSTSDAGIDISHLGQTAGSYILTQTKPLFPRSSGTGYYSTEVTVDFIGTGLIAGGTSGTLTITGGVAVSGVATCTGSSITLAVNDVVRGSASFKLA